MITILFSLNLLDPILATRAGGDPNTVESLSYAPGRMVQGALIGRFIKRHCGGDAAGFDAADPLARRLFFDGATRYLNAYLQAEIDRGKPLRLLPTPRSLRKPKSAPGDDNGLSAGHTGVEYSDHSQGEKDTQHQWKNAGLPFCHCLPINDADDYGPSRLYLAGVEYELNIHTARTRGAGRAMDRAKTPAGDLAGAIFRYQALAAGQSLRAAIVCDGKEEADELLKLLQASAGGPNHVSLGRSSSAEYGAAEIASVETVENWRECGGTLMPISGETFTVTLLSDVLLTRHGHFVADPYAACETVLRALKIEGLELELVPERTFVAGGVDGGFNRKWNLPLPQKPVLAMGSVLTFRIGNSPASSLSGLHAAAQRLEATGIGAQRNEGFGRVAINWHQSALRKTSRFDLVNTRAAAIAAESESYPLAQFLANDRFHRLIERQLPEAVNDVKIANAPKNAQLGRLREVVRHEMQPNVAGTAADKVKRIEKYLSEIEQRTTARRQFESARVGNKTLMQWLQKQLEAAHDEAAWKQIFDARKKIYSIPDGGLGTGLSIGGVKPTHGAGDIETRTRFLLRYLDGVLGRAVKERRHEQGTAMHKAMEEGMTP